MPELETEIGNSKSSREPSLAGKFYGQFDPPVDRFIFERYFPDTNIQGVFVECGAFDGLTECSCKFFEETMGWKAYNIEPVPWLFESLANNRPLSRNLNLALSYRCGEATFKHAISPLVGRDFGNGSLGHQPSHLTLLEQDGCTFETLTVTTVTWNEFVAQEHLTHVDLFVLDVEGHELEVIEGMRNNKVLPKIMCVKYGHIGLDTIRNAMSSLGYEYDITSNGNAYFVREDVLGLFALRRAKPVVLPARGPLAFVHISKCSGTSIENYLLDCGQIHGRADCFTGVNPQGEREDFKTYALRNAASPFVFGHIPYELFVQHFPDALFMTFLRDPVQRTISQYKSWHDPKNFPPTDPHYITSSAELKQAVKLAQDGTLTDFVTTDNSCIRAAALGNQQTLMLSSLSGVSLDEHLESAKKNLEKFAFIGLTERFAESICLFRSIFPDAPEYELARLSENRSRTEISGIPASVMDTIREQIPYDLALYEFATVLFEKRIHADPLGAAKYLLSNLSPQSKSTVEYLQTENQYLRSRVKELSNLYEEVTQSRAWRAIEALRAARSTLRTMIRKDTHPKPDAHE
jgi:FkbM family methyltransferase